MSHHPRACLESLSVTSTNHTLHVNAQPEQLLLSKILTQVTPRLRRLGVLRRSSLGAPRTGALLSSMAYYQYPLSRHRASTTLLSGPDDVCQIVRVGFVMMRALVPVPFCCVYN